MILLRRKNRALKTISLHGRLLKVAVAHATLLFSFAKKKVYTVRYKPLIAASVPRS